MNCPICGTTLQAYSIRNPLGLGRLDVLVCSTCHSVGSKELWEEVKK